MYLIQLILFLLLQVDQTPPAKIPSPPQDVEILILPEADAGLYEELHLEGRLSYDVFKKAMKGVTLYHPEKKFLAIADFGKASNEKRFFIIDLESR